MYFHRLDEQQCLRELALSDADELFAVCDANRAHLRRWLPWLDRTKAPADTQDYVESMLQQTESNQGFQTVILSAGRIVGMIGYHRIDWANRSTSLGYWLVEGEQGRGLMTASCQVLVDHAFAALNLHRIAIACATGNARSRAIPPRLGFRHEGTLREAEWLYDHYVDHEVYAQLQGEWQARIVAHLSARASSV